MEREPAELLPIMPPRLARLDVETSGPNRRSCAARARLSVEDDAGLDAGGARDRVDVEDGVEVFAAIEDDAGADRLAGQAGAAAARRDRHVHFARRSAPRRRHPRRTCGRTTPSGSIW